MKKLIIFIPSIEDGGVEKNLFLISNYLSKKINNIAIITANFEYKKNFSKKIKFLGVDLKFLRKKSRIFKYGFCLIQLMLQIIKENSKDFKKDTKKEISQIREIQPEIREVLIMGKHNIFKNRMDTSYYDYYNILQHIRNLYLLL